MKEIGFLSIEINKLQMNLFKSMFSNRSEEKEATTSFVNWIPLTNIDQFQKLKETSKNETVLIFKHSTRCIISRMVLKQFEKSFDGEGQNLNMYYLDLLNYRAISNEIASSFNVIHQSPQLLVIKNGVVVKHASHHDILGLVF